MWTCIEGGYSKQLLHTHIQRSMYITSTGPASAPCQNTWATADIYCTRTSSTACTLQSRDLHLEGYSGHPLYRYSLHYIHYTVTGPAPCQKIWSTADIHCTCASSIVYIYMFRYSQHCIHVQYSHGACICTLSKNLGYSGHLWYTYIQHCMYISHGTCI